jgi:hypothetical protein
MKNNQTVLLINQYLDHQNTSLPLNDLSRGGIDKIEMCLLSINNIKTIVRTKKKQTKE